MYRQYVCTGIHETKLQINECQHFSVFCGISSGYKIGQTLASLYHNNNMKPILNGQREGLAKSMRLNIYLYYTINIFTFFKHETKSSCSLQMNVHS